VRTTSADRDRRQRPPLTQRISPRHWAALDYVVGVFTTAVLFESIRQSLNQPVPFTFGQVRYVPLALAGPMALLLVLVAGTAVALRRRNPVLMLIVLLISSVLVTALTGPDAGSLTYFLPVAYVLYLVAATYGRRREAVRMLAAVFVTLIADNVLVAAGWHGFEPGALVSVTLGLTISWTVGYTVRQRRSYSVRLQDEAASKAVAQERLRIARELHDVVAHSMSVIAVQAGYGQYVIDSQPGDARAALGAIQATSREALDEMRRMLGALRQADESDAAGSAVAPGVSRDVPSGTSSAVSPTGNPAVRPVAATGGPGAPLFPAPGLAELDRLLSRTAGAGVRVDLTRVGQPRDLPASIDLSAYRIVQEALTNVVKHAQTSSCRVLIGYGDDELTIEITDNGAGVPMPELAGAGVPGHAAASHAGSGHAGSGHAGSGHAGSGQVGAGQVGAGQVAAGHDGAAARPAAGSWAGGGPAWTAVGASVSPGGGHGIIGMRERVSLLGGEFSAGPLPGYGFQVAARIPLPAPSGET
jgi:signal transduction histidine kinase